MTDLFRLKVRETHGMRRFLYPLHRELDLAAGIDVGGLALTVGNKPAPFQMTPLTARGRWRMDFATGLAPLEEATLTLAAGEPAPLPDPIYLDAPRDLALATRQERFAIGIDRQARIASVVYDGVPHLTHPTTVTLNGTEPRLEFSDRNWPLNQGLLAVWGDWEGAYGDKRTCRTRVVLTACKSWARIEHTIDEINEGDKVVFRLPFSATASERLVADFGTGGWTYGAIKPTANETIDWRAEHLPGGAWWWQLSVNKRIDGAGQSAGRAFASQRWFHVIDDQKSVAVAIADFAPAVSAIDVSIDGAGAIDVTFECDAAASASRFVICYHFLNDLPAIAAATSPQSILLPPAVIA